MQRIVLVAILAACIASLVSADELILGNREAGDALITTRKLYRFPTPGLVQRASTGFFVNGRITAVTAANSANGDVQLSISTGAIGTNQVVVMATGAAGSGIDLEFSLYAIQE